jgi:hypothetical protein
MVKTREAGQTRWAALLAWGSFGLGLTLSAGCSHAPMASAPPADPILGVMVPPGLPQPVNTPKVEGAQVSPTPQAFNQGGVPATPASNPATLAGNSWQGSPLGRPLAIDDRGPPFFPGQLTSGNKTQQVPGNLAPNPTPKVERVPDITPPNQPVTPTSAWQTPQPVVQTAAAQPFSEDALAKQLRDRGVINQKRDTVPEGLRLTCYVSRGPDGGLLILEVTAADYASAVQAILQKLDTSK